MIVMVVLGLFCGCLFMGICFFLAAMSGVATFIVETAWICGSIAAYWRTRLKGWLLPALGFFFLSTGFMGTVTLAIFETLLPHPIYRFVGLAFWLELYISAILIAIGWGLVFKRSANKYKAKQKQYQPPS
jgi:hypothetical protein